MAAKTTALKSTARMGVDAKRLPINGSAVLVTARPLAAKPETIEINGVPATHHTSADTILRSAAATIIERGTQRDSAQGSGERSMASTVAAFNAIEGTSLTERQGWAFMQTLKLVRAATSARLGKHDADSHLDGTAYAALAGEAASREECAGRTAESA